MSSSSLPPRRSLRSSARNKAVSFGVGDVVEVSYQNGIVHGKLLYKVTDDPPPNTRWMVTYESGIHKDEMVCEKSFGCVVKKGETSTALATSSSSSASSSPQSVLDETSQERRSRTVSEDSGVRGDVQQVQPSDDNGLAAASASTSSSSESSSTSDLIHTNLARRRNEGRPIKNEDDNVLPTPNDVPEDEKKPAAMTDRERRRRKREEARLLDEEESAFSSPPSGRAARPKRKSGGGVGGGVKPKTKKAKLKSQGVSIKDDNEEVVKVKLNTGTLYLYRGLHRRAVFVRRR